MNRFALIIAMLLSLAIIITMISLAACNNNEKHPRPPRGSSDWQSLHNTFHLTNKGPNLYSGSIEGRWCVWSYAGGIWCESKPCTQTASKP